MNVGSVETKAGDKSLDAALSFWVSNTLTFFVTDGFQYGCCCYLPSKTTECFWNTKYNVEELISKVKLVGTVLKCDEAWKAEEGESRWMKK